MLKLAKLERQPPETRSTGEMLGHAEHLFASVGLVADLSPEEAEVLRRSIAMLPPQVPSGLSRERALAILGQLVRALRELRHRANSG